MCVCKIYICRWADTFCLHCNIFIYTGHIWKKPVLCSHMVSLFLILHLEHTDAYSPYPVHIKMEEFSDVPFKQHAVTEFLTMGKLSPIEIHRRMQAVYGDQCVDVRPVRCWVRRFKDGEMGQADLSDKTQSGRPETASDELIRRNRRIKQKETAVALGISKERVGHIIGVLGFRKVCAI